MILNNNVVNFAFQKKDAGLLLRQVEHQIGSYIPFLFEIKTFSVKFNDEQSELSKGIPAYKLLMKSFLRYVKS